MRLTASFRASSRGPLLQVLKTSVAAIIAWLVCNYALNQPLPIFAAIAALLVVQPSVNQTLAKGLERSFGVIFGVLLAYGASVAFGDASWVVLAIIVVSLLLSWALRLSPGSANQIPISAMLVIAIGTQQQDYAAYRIVETIIGAAIGLAVNVLIVPPVLLAPAHDALHRLARDIAATLTALATTLRSDSDRAALHVLITDARQLRTTRDTVAEALTKAEESLMLNPRGGKHRKTLAHDRELFVSLTSLTTRVIGMARTLHDNYESRLAADPVVQSIAVELERAAHDLLLLVRDSPTDGAESTADAHPITAELPALTAPLVVTRPDPDNWILIGSLLEDLRRVRQEITGGTD